MANEQKIRNYDLLSGYNYFLPNPLQIVALLAFLLGGALIGNAVAAGFLMLMQGATMDVMTLISYPIMFIPAMLYAISASRRNTLFETGYNIDSENFGKIGGATLAIMVMGATFALAFLMDIVNNMMPDMPEWLEKALTGMTQGNFLINFVCVSIFAPFFEEWLCRGMVLRGLLNYSRRKGQDGEDRRGISPAWAIVISAAFFALIHMNPWQAVPAFALGSLFGYVYYRTGSLKLTMLMHFTNNTIALLANNIGSLNQADSWLEVMPIWLYCIIAVICVAYLYFFIRKISEIQLSSPHGNCDEIPLI